jgi:hypothetical protein
MYPIRIFGIRVPPDGHFEYALYDDTAREDGREPVTCFPTIEDLGAFVARMLFEADPDTAVLCVRQPDHMRNLLAFSAKPMVREFNAVSNPETKRLTSDERIAFMHSLHTELCSVDAEKKE